MEKLVTIFDFNPSEEEIKEALGHSSKEKYFHLLKQDDAYIDVAYMFYFRGEKDKMEDILSKVKNKRPVYSFWRTIDNLERWIPV